jgi:hypothetical protein
MNRALECKCGEHLEAANDAALLEELRRHAEVDHPDWSEGDLKVLAMTAHDQVAERVG